MDISKFKVEDDKRDGVWLQWEDAEFFIAYQHRPAFTRIAARIKQRYPDHKLKAKPELNQKMLCEVMGEAVLMDWRNVRENDKPLSATLENRIRLLNDIPQLREWVAIEAQELTNFQREAEAEDARALKSGDPVVTAVGEG